MIRAYLIVITMVFSAPALAQSQPQPAVEELLYYMDNVPECFDDANTPAMAKACIGTGAALCMDSEEGGYSTVGTMFCLLAEHHTWDALLNEQYTEIMEQFRRVDAENRAAFNGQFGQRADFLLQAQRGWIAFRDGQCALEYALWGSGSMRQIAGADCQLQMTAERTIELRFMGEDMY